ncbi:MAG TPA: 50S ribosomal protein L11 methyltransferase [Stellaceae bacterium]
MPGRDRAAFIRANTAIASPSLVPELLLHLATAVTPLWHATEASLAQSQLPPPYWAFAWPGGQALARYLLDHPDRARGKRVLDFGAGCGIAGIAALKAGAAQASAFEIDPFAACAIALNGALNGAAPSVFLTDVLASGVGHFSAADIILVGDMCYERPLADRLAAWLNDAVAAGVTVLIGDPGRAYLPKQGLEFVISYAVPTSLDLEDRINRDTAVYRLRKP